MFPATLTRVRAFNSAAVLFVTSSRGLSPCGRRCQERSKRVNAAQTLSNRVASSLTHGRRDEPQPIRYTSTDIEAHASEPNQSTMNQSITGAQTRVRCRAFAPGRVGNIGPGLDILGCALTGDGDAVEARVEGKPGV